MNNQEITKYEKLRILMYGMTLDARKDNREFWRLRGIARMTRGGKDDLFNYWKNKMDNDPVVEKEVEELWPRYLRGIENAKKRAGIANSVEKEPLLITPASLAEQTKSIITAFKNLAKNGFTLAEDSVYEERLAICHACPHWDPAAFLNTGSCKLCGCSTKAKLRLPLEKCPIDKWLPVNVQAHQLPNLETPGDQSTQVSQ